MRNLLTPAISQRRNFSWIGALCVAVISLLPVDQAQAQAASTNLAGSFQFASGTINVTESEGTATGRNIPGAFVLVTRSLPARGRVMVDYATLTNGTAAPGKDFVTNSGTLIFNDYQMSSGFIVGLTDNTTSNANKTVKMTLSNPRPAPDENPALVPAIGTPKDATININDDDSGFNFDRFSYIVREDEGQVVVTVKIADAFNGDAAVDYAISAAQSATQPGSLLATGDADFVVTNGTLNFPNGTSSQTFTVEILDDDLVELNEDLTITLSNARARITIQVTNTTEDPGTGEEGSGSTTNTTVEDVEMDIPMGKAATATVTIISEEKPAGAADPDYNPEMDTRTFPQYNAAPGANNTVYSSLLLNNGNVLIGGDFTAVNAVSRGGIALLNTNGAINTNFNIGNGANGFVGALATNAAGQIYVGGGFTAINGAQRYSMARLFSDGSLDPAFNPGISILGPVRAIVPIPAGTNGSERVAIAGDFESIGGVSRRSIAQLLASGALDSSFDPGQGADGPIYAMIRQSDGKLVIGGDFNYFSGVPRNYLARLNADGSLDQTFNPGTGMNGPVYGLAFPAIAPATIAAAGVGSRTNVYQAGSDTGLLQVNFTFDAGAASSTNQSLRVYYQTNLIYEVYASITETNGTNGSFNVQFGPGPVTQFSILINEGQENVTNTWRYTGTITTGLTNMTGRILAVGNFTTANMLSRPGIAEFNPDGSVDDFVVPGRGANGPVYSVSVARNSKIYIGGAFTQYNGARRVGFARLLADGKLDTTFQDPALNQHAGLVSLTSLDPISFVNTIAIQEDANVFIGGYFTKLGGGYSTNYLNNSVLYKGAPYWFVPSRTNYVTRYNFARMLGGVTPGPGNLELVLDTYPVDENGGNAGVTVQRVGGTLGNVSLKIATQDQSAVAAADYTAQASMEYKWSNGLPRTNDAPGILSIPILDDTLIEGDESFLVNSISAEGLLTLQGLPIPVAPSFGRDTAKVIIADNDFSQGSLSFATSSMTVDEIARVATVSIARSGGALGNASVEFYTRSLTNDTAAVENADFVPLRRTISFAPGQTNRTISVEILDDTIVENDESLSLVLANPTGGVKLGAFTNLLLTIIDNDYAPGRLGFGAASGSAVENETSAQVNVRRTGGSSGSVAVFYTTTDGTAQAGIDFASTSGVLNWSDGDTSEKTISVPLQDDSMVDGNKTFQIFLLDYVGALPGARTNITVTIRDDDSFGRLAFTLTNYIVGENEGTAVIPVVRGGGYAGQVSATYVVSAGSAVAGADFVAETNTFQLADGQISTNLIVTLVDDTQVETNKTIQLRILDPVNASLGSIASATLTIVDNESFNTPAGQLDTGFSPVQTDRFVNAIAIQTNGSLVIGGDFTTVNGITRGQFARLLPNGALDTMYNNGIGANGAILGMALQQDGKVVAGGRFTSVQGTARNYIARFNTDGAVDLSYNPGAGADNPVYAVTVQSDGKALIGGEFGAINGLRQGYLARLQTNGLVDLTFASGAGADGTIYAIALQPDGKIIIGGSFTRYDGVPQNGYARLNANGTLDRTFNTLSGADGPIRAIAIQPDGRILLGGLFTAVNQVNYNRIARLNPNGSLDTTFQIGEGANSAIYALALQSDGRILVGGDFTRFNGITRNRITRLNANGSVDPTINFGAGADSFVTAIAIQPDRKIVLGGGFTTFNNVPRGHIARIHGGSLLGSGNLEFISSRFGVNESQTNITILVRRTGGTSGRVTVDYGTFDQSAIADQDYFRLGGTLTFAEGETLQSFVFSAINDSEVETDETAALFLSNVTGGASLGSQPNAEVLIQSDDSRISFGASNYSVNENVPTRDVAISVIRSGATNGISLVAYEVTDNTATSGLDFVADSNTLTFNPGETIKYFSVSILDDTLVEGNENVTLTLVATTEDAILGNANAILTIVENDVAPGSLRFAASSYRVDENGGAAVISVIRTNGYTGVVSVRYQTSDGTAQAGVDYMPASGTLAFADGESSKTFTIPILDDLDDEGNEIVNLQLFDWNGAQPGTPSTATLSIVDNDFGPGSIDAAFDPGTGANNTVRSLALQPDGRIVAGGLFTRFNNAVFNRVVRLNSNGTTDTFTSSGVNGAVNSVALQTDGRISLGGAFTNFAGTGRSYAGRLNTNGAVDTTFSQNARENNQIFAVAPQPDGKVIVGGQFTIPSGGLARLSANGSLDISFNADGGVDGTVYALTLQSDGKIMAGGRFNRAGGMNRGGIVRLFNSGLVDAGFNAVGTTGTVYSVLPQPNGRYLVGGLFSRMNGATRNNIARLSADGSLDSSFNPTVGANGAVNAIALQSDGKIIIGGDFTSYNSTNRTRIARLNADGSLDLSFNPGLGANATVFSALVQSDGKILIGGAFSAVNGLVRNGVARFRGDSSETFQFTSITRLMNGEVYMTLETVPGATHVIEGSENLRQWLPLSTNTAVGTTLEYSDPDSINSNHRIYRSKRINP